MKKIISALLFIVGVIHLLPLAGVIGPEKLSALYGIQVDEPNLSILMRHRAVLFGLLGLFICYAGFRPTMQFLALLGGFISVGSFLWLAWGTGGYNALIGRVVVADIMALICLVIASVLYALNKKPANLSLDTDAARRST
jgi:hypothetical protein